MIVLLIWIFVDFVVEFLFINVMFSVVVGVNGVMLILCKGDFEFELKFYLLINNLCCCVILLVFFMVIVMLLLFIWEINLKFIVF